MIHNFSKFYYDFEVTQDNLNLPFDEGSGEIVAAVQRGSYSPSKGLLAVTTALNGIGTQGYSVTLDRITRLVTISASANFTLPVQSTAIQNNIFSLLGFNGADRTGSNVYTGDSPTSMVYTPQFKLQGFIPAEINKKSIDPTVKKTADGSVEVVRFGVERFIEMEIMYATNMPMDGKVIKNNPSGYDDLILFMDHITRKSQVEFMPDADSPEIYQNLILESTPNDRDGLGYQLKELYSKGLPDIYETGRLIFREFE